MAFQLIQSLPKQGHRFALPGLHGSADACALAQAGAALKAQKKMLAIVVANPADAQRLLAEIPWFAQEGEPVLRCHLLPDWETLPYDAFSPHQDLVSERLATLYEMQNGQCDVLIVPATTALVRMAPQSFLAAYTFFFKQGEVLDEVRLKTQLSLAGYTPVSQVMSPGEYSVRGGLIDLFPMGSALPYRIDLFGDTIETIRTFDADTQRSLYPVREVPFAVAGAKYSKVIHRARRSTRTSVVALRPPVSSTTCRCFLKIPARCSITFLTTRHLP
jgi:transcription-repair coupling factor (superfamily II helicase)